MDPITLMAAFSFGYCIGDLTFKIIETIAECRRPKTLDKMKTLS